MDNRTILSDVKSSLKKYYGDFVKSVILFGSQISGKSNRYSDYDILIILNDNYTSYDENKIFDICYEINLKYNIILDIHILSKDEIITERGKQPIFINAIKSGLYADG